jgi:hypothetical protein
MSNEQLISALKQIEVLVAECLKTVGSGPGQLRKASKIVNGKEQAAYA